jgi:glycosyltransferase involved in cell wall biosynthesis
MSSVNGWAETHFKNNNVEFIRIEGNGGTGEINTGSVLDAFGRPLWSISQISKVIELIKDGTITKNDVIFTEDFWHSGIDSLFYIRAVAGIDFKIGCFIHAQSIDESDFTYPFRNWMRPIEIGYSRSYDYVFTCSEILKQYAVLAGYNEPIVTGLPFNSVRLKEQLKEINIDFKKPKKLQVLFSSRFDAEKNPNFFLDLVEAMNDIDFTLCKPRKHLSNIKDIEDRASKLKNLNIVDTSNKQDYYKLLQESMVQFNCANQDWVSWTLLEATLFNCVPIYPYHKDFPLELDYNSKYLYKHLDLEDAIYKTYKALIDFDSIYIPKVYEKHDQSWNKQLKIMGL